MTGTRHLLEIYDPEDTYQGPNPLHVTGAGLVRGPECSQYYILELEEPQRIDGHDVRQLAVRPHYDGDPIENPIEGTCTVGIAYNKPGAAYQPGEQYGFRDFCFWSVGKIHKANGHGG